MLTILKFTIQDRQLEPGIELSLQLGKLKKATAFLAVGDKPMSSCSSKLGKVLELWFLLAPDHADH